MRRVKLPVNPRAARIANEKLLAQTGGKPLDLNAPNAHALREKWLDAYAAAGGKVESETFSPRAAKSPIQPCPLSHIELQYLHVDTTPVCGAGYEIRSLTNQLLYKGVLDGNGHVRINGVPREHNSFLFHFKADPAPYIPSKQPAQKPDREATRSMVEEVGGWLWGTMQGDFNKDPSISQVAVNTLLGLIPLVDQALDVRDIIAGLKDVIEFYMEDEEQQKKHASILGVTYEVWLWLNIFIIAIGCIPELGSVIKGVLKGFIVFLVDAGKKVDELTPRQLQDLWEKLVRILNHFGKGNAHEWLKQFPDKIDQWMNEAIKTIRPCMTTCESLLKKAEEHLNSWYARWAVDAVTLDKLKSRLRRLRSSFQKAYAHLDLMKAQVNQWLRDQISKMLLGKNHLPQPGSAGRSNTRVQHEEPPPGNKSGRVLAKQLAEKRAKELAEKEALDIQAEYGKRNKPGKPNCTSGVVDQRTGKEWSGTSGEGRYSKPIHPDLQQRIKEIPEEDLVDKHGRPASPTRCAEFRALNDALHDGARLEDLVVYTAFTDSKPPNPAPRCPRCRVTVTGVSSILSDK